MPTLHTNSAIGAITRLRDMGIEPFLLASSLIGVLAQRLVRVLDPAQSETYEPSAAECRALGHDWQPGLRFARPRPDAGRSAGYSGRTGLYELIAIDDTLRRLIHEGAGEHELLQHARQHSPSLADDGWQKVCARVTSVEEVLRVSRERE